MRTPTHIKAWRKDRGLTLAKLSERLMLECELEISDGQLSRIERGEQGYTQDLLEALAKVLRCAPAHLITKLPDQPRTLQEAIDELSPSELRQATKIIEAIRGTGTDG